MGISRVDSGTCPQAICPIHPAAGEVAGKVFLREPLGLEGEVTVDGADGAL